MPAKGQTIPIETQPQYGRIFNAIIEGHDNLYQISKYLNKKHPTIYEQLQKLEKKRYIKKVKLKDNRGTTKYSINKNALLKYWKSKGLEIEDFSLLKKEDCTIDIIFNSALGVLFSYLEMFLKTDQVSIDSIGEFFKKDGGLKRFGQWK